MKNFVFLCKTENYSVHAQRWLCFVLVIIIIIIIIVTAWLSGNALVLINVVALRRARLVLGWVTVRGYIILVFNQTHPGLLSLAILRE